jgi:hypothetical protein
MTNTTNSDDLNEVINDMLTRIGKVAELVDQVFPDKEIGIGIKECGNKLREHVNTLSIKASGIDILDDDPVKAAESLTDIATKECLASFKQVKAFRETNLTDTTFDSLSLHARELLAILLK